MGLIKTLFDYGHRAYDDLKPRPEKLVPEQRQNEAEDVSYSQIKLSGEQPSKTTPRIEIKTYQQQVGQETAYIQATLRQKVAEYGLAPTTKLSIYRDEIGAVKLEANIPSEIINKIEFDLNQNPDFKQRFLKVSEQSPTLNYLQNVDRIRSTYGTENEVVNTLLSKNSENNSLQAISQRFERLNQVSQKETITASAIENDSSKGSFSIAI